MIKYLNVNRVYFHAYKTSKLNTLNSICSRHACTLDDIARGLLTFSYSPCFQSGFAETNSVTLPCRMSSSLKVSYNLSKPLLYTS